MIFKKPANAEITRRNNIVVGYMGKFIVIKSEEGQLYYSDIGNPSIIPIGYVVEDMLLKSINTLPEDERKEIEFLYGDNRYER